MLAHDNPTKNHKLFGVISLAQYLDYNRNGDNWDSDVIAYHITESGTVSDILINGLIANTTTKGMAQDRPNAVYLFSAKSVINDNIAVLGITNPVILKITIPASATGKLYPDNIYNMSIDAAQMSAMQYRDNIPPEWITIASVYKPVLS